MKWRIDNYSKVYEDIIGKFDVNLWIPTERGIPLTALDPKCWAHLFITLKIFYEKDNSGSGLNMNEVNAAKYKVATWPDSEWNNYKNEIKSLSTFWDLKFWLVLKKYLYKSPSYQDIQKYLSIYESKSGSERIVYPRVISCRFNLVILDNPAGAHQHIKVAYLVDKATGATTNINTFTNRSRASYYDNGDIKTDTNGYNTIIHELGHSIGLPHIGIITGYDKCFTTDNGKRVYSDPKDKANGDMCYNGPLADTVMGGGNRMDWRFAVPWRFALEKMTGVPLDYYWVGDTPHLPFPENAQSMTPESYKWRDFFG